MLAPLKSLPLLLSSLFTCVKYFGESVAGADTQKIHPSLLLPQSGNIEEELSGDFGTVDH